MVESLSTADSGCEYSVRFPGAMKNPLSKKEKVRKDTISFTHKITLRGNLFAACCKIHYQKKKKSEKILQRLP